MAGLIAIAMSAASYVLQPVERSEGWYGICLPSPQLWGLPDLLSWLLNLMVILAVAILLFLINKHFNFVRTTEPALPAVFVIATASSPWFTEGLNTSTLLCLVNVVSLGIIFGAYDRKNATPQVFCIGFLTGLGSMFQYAFIPMIGVYFIWALFLKVLRLKETLALLIGLLCPYWIALGFGLISLHDFHLPTLIPFFGNDNDLTELFFLICGVGFATIASFLVSLVNGMKLYAGNSRVNAMNLCVTAMGLASVICILVDYENMTTYVVTLYVAMAVQAANICALWNLQQEWLVSAIPSVIYIGLFMASVLI